MSSDVSLGSYVLLERNLRIRPITSPVSLSYTASPTQTSGLLQQRMQYFSEFWNTIEFIKLILSITSISMYAMKNIYVHVALGDLTERQGER